MVSCLHGFGPVVRQQVGAGDKVERDYSFHSQKSQRIKQPMAKHYSCEGTPSVTSLPPLGCASRSSPSTAQEQAFNRWSLGTLEILITIVSNWMSIPA